MRVRERSEYGACIIMQIIAVGVTNRRDQQEARFIAFVVPFGQPRRMFARFLAIYDTLTTISPRKFACNSGSGDFRADNDRTNESTEVPNARLCSVPQEELVQWN